MSFFTFRNKLFKCQCTGQSHWNSYSCQIWSYTN